MKERLEDLVAGLRRQRVVERISACKNVQEAEEIYRKIKKDFELITTAFILDFEALCQRNKKFNKVIKFKVKPEDAILICILCHMTSITHEELLDGNLKVALKKASRKISLKERILKRNPQVAKRLLNYIFKEKNFLDSLEDEEFVKFFL